MRYHREIWFPDNIKALIPNKEVKINYSKHAIEESKKDRYGVIVKLPNSLFVGERHVDIIDDEKNTLLVRKHYNSELDISFVLVPDRMYKDKYLVKTLWLNLKSDKHLNCNKSLFVHKRYFLDVKRKIVNLDIRRK